MLPLQSLNRSERSCASSTSNELMIAVSAETSSTMPSRRERFSATLCATDDSEVAAVVSIPMAGG